MMKKDFMPSKCVAGRGWRNKVRYERSVLETRREKRNSGDYKEVEKKLRTILFTQILYTGGLI